MIKNKDTFDKLIAEAWNHEFSGWDFVYISKRMLQNELSWNYHQLVLEKIKTANSLLDLDTGGGEFLFSLQPLPQQTFATEAYPPNVPIAKSRLEPFGVQVKDTPATGHLPFEDGFFDLIINRHGDIHAPEIFRILKTGKHFITQQVGGRNNIRLNEVLQDKVEFRDSGWTMHEAIRQLEASGFSIIDSREEFPAVEFKDIGAVVYYLKAIPWQVDDFSIERYYDKLESIHQIIEEKGKFESLCHRFYIEAQKIGLFRCPIQEDDL
jgi:SAM-dependent methyltransferase